MYYSKDEYKALSFDHREALYKKIQDRVYKPAEKKVGSKRSGATDKPVKQVYALVAVMKPEKEAPGTATSSTNSKNPALTRQIIICE